MHTALFMFVKDPQYDEKCGILVLYFICDFIHEEEHYALYKFFARR